MQRKFDLTRPKIFECIDLLELNLKCLLSDETDQSRTSGIYNARHIRARWEYEAYSAPTEFNERYSSPVDFKNRLYHSAWIPVSALRAHESRMIKSESYRKERKSVRNGDSVKVLSMKCCNFKKCTFEMRHNEMGWKVERDWQPSSLQPGLHCVRCQTDSWSLLEPRPTHLYPDKCRDWSWVHFLAVATLPAIPIIAAGVQYYIWTTSSQATWDIYHALHF